MLTLLMSAVLGLSAVPYALAQSPVSTTTFTGTEYTSTITCTSLLGSTPVFPPPTQSISSDHTSISSAATRTTYVTFVVVTAEPTPVTATSTTTSTSWITTQGRPNTFEVFEYATSTLTNVTLTSTVCAGASPVTTVTKYTGTFKPSTTVTAYPTSVICTNEFTSLLTYWPYVYYPTSTDTYTPATTVATTTVSKTITLVTTLPATEPDKTVTVSGTSYVVGSERATTTVDCPSTKTTTLNAKCAPTNMIGAIDGTNGIYVLSGEPGSASTYGLVEEGRDPSLCCQLCLDTEGCAGSATSPDAGNCGLYFTNSTSAAEGECGEAFSYGTNGNTGGAYSGFIVQSGCGIILDAQPLQQLSQSWFRLMSPQLGKHHRELNLIE